MITSSSNSLDSKWCMNDLLGNILPFLGKTNTYYNHIISMSDNTMYLLNGLPCSCDLNIIGNMHYFRLISLSACQNYYVGLNVGEPLQTKHLQPFYVLYSCADILESFFLTAVILPTLWLYLEHRFDAEQWFFGVVFAAFPFSSLLSSPLFGFWVDYTQKTKTVILFANLFEIGG